MAPRANWKGYLRLSLVSCPVALYPATTENEKVRFHRLNRKTGHRVRIQNVDDVTHQPVDRDDIVRGFEATKGHNIEVTDEELQSVQIESTRTIEIDKFVPHEEIDQLYNIRPYYIAPEGDVGVQAFAVIREAIEKQGMVAIGRVVLTNREHVIALEPRGRGLMGTLLRYPYEVRSEKEYFAEIPQEKIPKDMLDLALHIVQTKTGHFDPSEFDDRYENALKDLLRRKAAGEAIEPAKEQPAPNVISLMDALRKSLEQSGRQPSASEEAKAKKPKKKAGARTPRKAAPKRARKAS